MTETARISSFAIHNNMLRDINRHQTNLFELQNQISSGLKTDNFAGLDGSVEMYIDFESKVRRSQRYMDNITVALARVETAGVALNQMVETAEDTKALITQWRGIDKDNLAFAQQIESMRATFTSQMNINMEGRYLFSGSRTDVPPITETLLPNTETGVPDANYYQGSDTDMTFRASDSLNMVYNIRGDHEAFQNIYAAFDQALQAHAAKDDNAMERALELISTGVDKLLDVQTQNNSNKITLDNSKEMHGALKTYYQGQAEALISTDIVQATTELAYKQATLQASYQTFARMNELKLADFLR